MAAWLLVFLPGSTQLRSPRHSNNWVFFKDWEYCLRALLSSFPPSVVVATPVAHPAPAISRRMHTSGPSRRRNPSPSTDRPLYGLKRFSTTIAKHLNDLPITSPHGSDFDATRKLLKLHRFERSTRHSDGTPQQMLRHPQRLSGHCEAKNGTKA